MSELAERLRLRHFGTAEHPYNTFRREVGRHLRSGHTLVDAGCGRTALVLRNYRGHVGRLIGIDAVDLSAAIDSLELYNRDIANAELPDKSVDIIMARSVMEHVTYSRQVFDEFARVLRSGGRVVFLTANLWNYASLIAAAVPNRFHPWLVARTEGRQESDVFPIQYRCNTRRAIRRHAARAGLQIERFEYLGQYPCYFMFNGALFWLATRYEKLISSVRPGCADGSFVPS